MGNSILSWHCRRAQLVQGLAIPLCLSIGLQTHAADPPIIPIQPSEISKAAIPLQAGPLSLLACQQIALERQPALAGYRCSLAAAHARLNGLLSLHSIAQMARDVPIRRQQASIGITIAQAQLDEAILDIRYAVVRNYWTAVYAKQQLKVADDTIKRLTQLRKEAEDAGNWVMDQINIYMELVRGRRETAVLGFERALVALREAMGVGPDCPLDVEDQDLPQPLLSCTRQDIVHLAVTLRPEMIQASGIARIVALEINAQAASLLPTARTFASGSDLHARSIPAGEHGSEYVPRAIGPEMPTLLVGTRPCRVEIAKALSGRADAVVDKTRNLIVLEAEDAYLRWLEASNKLPRFTKAATDARKLAEKLQKDAKVVGASVTLSDANNASVLASQLEVQRNETHFQLILALADLERITVGGFCAGFAFERK